MSDEDKPDGLAPIPEQGDTMYEAKTVLFKDRSSRYGVTIVRWYAGVGTPFDVEGYGGDEAWFVVFTGPEVEAHYDPRKIDVCRSLPNLKDFLLGVKRGIQTGNEFGISWRQIQDGALYTPQFVEGMR